MEELDNITWGLPTDDDGFSLYVAGSLQVLAKRIALTRTPGSKAHDDMTSPVTREHGLHCQLSQRFFIILRQRRLYADVV